MLWIITILRYHSSFLMSVPNLQRRLSLLMRLLSDRSASYKKILRLRGRLDLVLACARSLTGDTIDFAQAQIPLVEVEEGVLDTRTRSSSEEEEEEEEEEEKEESSEDTSEDESKSEGSSCSEIEEASLDDKESS